MKVTGTQLAVAITAVVTVAMFVAGLSLDHAGLLSGSIAIAVTGVMFGLTALVVVNPTVTIPWPKKKPPKARARYRVLGTNTGSQPRHE